MDTKVTLACVLLIGGAIGLVAPELSDADPSAPDSAVPADAQSEFRDDPRLDTVITPAQGWSENVVLDRQADGHFYADVRVDGQTYRMLVDTGASVVALTGEDAAAMGLEWFDDDVQPVARGAGGPISGVNATIDQMSVGTLDASRVRAVIIPQGAGISLLGQSFLSTIGSVQISGDQMVLGN